MDNSFKDKKIVIMGLGLYEGGSGVAAAEFFAKQKARVLITDLRSKDELSSQIRKLKKYKNIKYILGSHREEDFKNCDIVIKNPAVPKDSKYLKIAEKNNVPIHNDWSIFLTQKDNFLVAVTGTRGKSTTATLIYELLKKKLKIHLCGNIGVSPLAIISKIKKEDVLMAELSSWLLHNFKIVKKSPNISVITNLMPDHLDKYKSLKEYYNDKKNIFKYQKKDDILILNKDNKETKKLAKEAKSDIFWFSEKALSKKEKGVFLKENNVYFQDKLRIIKVVNIKKTKLQGEHNKQNILAALCVACILNIKKSDLQKVVNDFSGVKNRLEFLRELRGVKFYNDTTATSPDASIVALKTLSKDFNKTKNIILLAGGSDKKLDYKEFAKYIKRYTKSIILFNGDATEKIKKELRKIKYKNILAEVDNMEDAVSEALKNSKKEDVVLLSPGAASFGVFKNEFDRGDKFRAAVKKVI